MHALTLYALLACAARKAPIEPTIDIPEPAVASTAAPDAAVRFAVMGDIPYAEAEWGTLDRQIADLGAVEGLSFFVHVGDIKTGGSACEESIYEGVRESLLASAVPALILVGDNEWNDCDKGGVGPSPDGGWASWQAHLATVPERWDTPDYDRQDGRPENRAWTEDGVLFIGLLLPGGRVHDEAEWEAFLSDDARWVRDQFISHADAEAAVIFGHANPTRVHAPVVHAITESAEAFGKPVLYVHGDGHVWQDVEGWKRVENLRRVQVTQGGFEDPLLITAGPEGFELQRGATLQR